jgi:glycosyltransferase involved in cell wall biosynthesis
MNVVNLSELKPGWEWLKTSFAHHPQLHWGHETDQEMRLPGWVPRPHTAARLLAAWRATGLLDKGEKKAILVTHGPRPAMYGALGARLRHRQALHLAFSFNFTDLPKGGLRRAMALSYKQVDRFVVFSTMERTLYARYFDLPIERFDMLHWAVQPPPVSEKDKPLEQGDYACAIGSQARDYAALADAMKRLPHRRLVLVATRGSLHGIDVPSNVTVRSDIPFMDAMNILVHSQFMVLPLRDSEVPCGHVTLVSAMHLGKAILVTDSLGVADYVQPGVNGLTVAPRDARKLAEQIDLMFEERDAAARMGAAGKRFASEHCSEQKTIDYFARYLKDAGLLA